MVFDTGIVEVQRPPGATVAKAFLFSASTGFSGYIPQDGDVTIAGASVIWDPAHTMANGIESYNVAADVTSLVKPTLDAGSGVIELAVSEGPSPQLDGELLAVVWADSAAPSRTISLMYGALRPDGDSFEMALSEPLKPSATATMSLGISFGYQPVGQYSTISVNGNPLTASAGGYDDGQSENGSLITVGGIGDSPENPADVTESHEYCDEAPRCDDESYDLKAVVDAGATSFTVETTNPSHDDNIFFAAFDIRGAASIGDSVILTPGSTRGQVGSVHTLVAKAAGADGKPVDALIQIKSLSGPSAGKEILEVKAGAKVTAFVESSKAGVDEFQASYVGHDGIERYSNVVKHEWIDRVYGTFAGSWPYDGERLVLSYSYDGDHRYLGNIVQAANNWTNSDSNVKIQPWPGVPARIHLPVIDVYRADTWWGLTNWNDDLGRGCQPPDDDEFGACSYAIGYIYLNQRTLDAVGDAQRTKTSTHEFGHALGLIHTQLIDVPSHAPSVMWSGNVGGRVTTTPGPADTSRLKELYP